ncbi:MAG: DinB family protein [Saprospiraceae bacterium]|nr:DinB family protein [Saprospiraceae bacterium]
MYHNLAGDKRALLDEYKRAIEDLILIIEPLDDILMAEVVDNQTKDSDCKSVQTILSHVVSSGFGYIVYMENHLGKMTPRPPKVLLPDVGLYVQQLRAMFDYAVRFFMSHPDIELEEMDNAKKMTVPWGQQYDVEQLMEHAIVHVLRHRRQIANFMAIKGWV